MACPRAFVLVATALSSAALPAWTGPPTSAALAPGLCSETATIREIRIVRVNVFDPSLPNENLRIFRFVNLLHSPMLTRESTVRSLLTIRVGDRCDPEALEEAARVLRDQAFLQDAWVRPVAQTHDGGIVVEVRVQDSWSTRVRASFSSEGGEDESTFAVVEANVLGTGSRLSWERREDQDRTERTLEYESPALFGSVWRTSLAYSDNSDGRKTQIGLVRPFYRLNERWALDLLRLEDTREEKIYACDATSPRPCVDPLEIDRYEADVDVWHARAGWAPFGVENQRLWRAWGGVRRVSERWTSLSEAFAVTRPDLRPADRDQTFLTLELDWRRIDFRVLSYINSARRVEDFDLGDAIRAEFAFAPAWLTEDEGAQVTVTGRKAIEVGLAGFLVGEMTIEARRLRAGSRGTRVALGASYYVKPSPLQSIVLDARLDWSDELPGHERILLGGERGMRAYASRSFVGSRALVVSGEHRFFTPWFVARILRLGLVGFAEVGAAWEEGESLRWEALRPGVGLGLRAQIVRSSGATTLHLNAAYPLDPDAGDQNDGIRFSVLTRTGF